MSVFALNGLSFFSKARISLLFSFFILYVSLSSFSQSYVKVFRPKGSSAPGSDFHIFFNGREVAALKSGQKLEYQLFGTGTLSVDVTSPNIQRENQNALQIEISAGEIYYIEVNINEYLELYFKEVNMYQGQAKYNDVTLFRKSDALISLKDDAFNPVLTTTASSRNTLTPDDYKTPLSHEKIKIRITEPDITKEKIHEFYGETLIVKGVVSPGKIIDEISVNGTKAMILRDSIFEASVFIDQFLESDVSVKAFTKSGTFEKVDFKVKRVLSEYDMAKRDRQGKDYILILATNEYDEYNTLVNPIFDANRIGKELEENYGFVVDYHFNNTQKDIYLTLKEYSKKAFHPDDQLLIFFAGHGDFDYLFTEGYVVCRDTKKEDEARSSFISHSNLRTIINSLPCQHIFLVMDVCFGGTFDPVVAARGDEYTETDKEIFIKRKMQHKTRLYLTSGGKEYVPDGRPGMHSPFAKSFIQALISGGGDDGILTYGELMQHIEKTIPAPQSGEFGDNALGSDFLFILK